MKTDVELSLRVRVLLEGVAGYLDVLAIAVYLVLANVLIVSFPDGSVVRALGTVPLLFFVPGYAVVLALYPRRSERGSTSRARTRAPTGRIDWRQRGVLSVGLSVGFLSMLGVVVSLLGFTLADRWVVVASLDAVVVAGLAVGLARRIRVPPDERFYVPYRQAVRRLFRSTSRSRPNVDRALSLVVLALVLVSVCGFAYALVAPPSAEQYTTITLVTENESGEYVAGDYPTNLTRGEQASLTVRIENMEAESVEYTVVPVLQRVEPGNGSVQVLEQHQLDPITVRLDAGEQTYETHTFTPPTNGTNLRLAYLLYKGDPPADPSVESAYRHVYIWVNVSEPDTEPGMDALQDPPRTSKVPSRLPG